MIKLLVSPATLEKALKDLQKSQGALVGFKEVGIEGQGDMKACKVLVNFEKGVLVAVVALDSTGLIAGFRLKPTTEISSRWQCSSYADPKLSRKRK